ncbi:MAG TPA: hypothetical protein VFZ53_19480 [Polyangiaceae bacterium]
MHRSHRSLLSFLTLGVAVAIACGPKPIEVPEDDDDDDGTGTGATTGSGGSFGGVSGTFNGGAFSGGTFSGGTATGGFSGTPMTGGTFTGGTTATGGALPTGGATATGGALPTGGTAGAGVSGAAGSGPAAMCDAAFAVGADGFVRAPGAGGCWYGYAFSGGDVGSTLTTMTSFAMCGAACMLRVAGTLGPATAANMYTGVVYLGFNISQPAGATAGTAIVPTGTGLQVTYTKVSGPTTIRVQIQDDTTRWCAPLTASPATIPYTSFNTMCWETVPPATGAYAKQPIKQVQLVAPGGEMAVPIDMTLVSVKDM